MKQVFAVAAALTVLAGVTAPVASAAAPTTRQLQAQISSLRKDLAATKTQLKKVQKQAQTAQDYGISGIALGFCAIAVTADAFQGTWATINQVALGASQSAIYPTQTPVNDSGVCSSALRIPRSQVVPPTTATFSALLNLLNGRIAPVVLVPSWWKPFAS
jgi:hypothetical protein